MAEEVKFSKGTEVEVRSEEPGFEGSWYAATVLRFRSTSGRVSVQYHSLMSEEDESKPLTAVVDVAYVRPLPPVDAVAAFEAGDEVDAFYNDGWWDGTIKEAVGDSKYVVHFSRTGEEMEFGTSDLRHHLDWIDGKWVLKDKTEIFMTPQSIHGIKSAGHKQWQAGDITKNPMVSFQLVISEDTKAGDEEELPLCTLLSNVKKTGRSSSQTEVELSQPCKKSKIGEEIQDGPCLLACGVVSEGVEPLIGMEARSDVATLVKEASGRATCSGEQRQLEKCGPRSPQKNRKASHGMAVERQRGVKGKRKGRLKAKALNTKPPITDMEQKASGGGMINEFVEQECLLNISEMLDPGWFLGISNENDLSPSIENGELSCGKGMLERLCNDSHYSTNFSYHHQLCAGDLPIEIDHKFARVEEQSSNNEVGKQLNESRPISHMLERIIEGHALQKDFEAQERTKMIMSSSFSKLEDLTTFCIRSDEARSKEQDVVLLQSLGGQFEPSEGVIMDKGSHVIASTFDKPLPTDSSLPFVKSSPAWEMVESMEAFHIMPQRPHFHLLEQHCEEYREAMALGHMLAFANLVASTHNSQFEDPSSVLEKRLKALTELEEHGFDVQLVRARLREMSNLKNKHRKFEEKTTMLKGKIIEREHEKDSLHTNIDQINKDIFELEHYLTLLHEKRALILKQKESNDHEIVELQKELQVIGEEYWNVKHDFRSVATAPW